MIFTGEIENQLHELLYYVRNHKQKLSDEEKLKLSEMLVSVETKIRNDYELTSGYYLTAESKAVLQVVEKLEKEGKLKVY